MLRTGRKVGNGDVSLVRIFVRNRIACLRGKNPQVVTRYAWKERPLRCDSPTLDMTFQEISVFLQIFCGRLVRPFASKASGADQRGNVRCQRGRRIAADLLPAFLRSDRTMADEISSPTQDHWV